MAAPVCVVLCREIGSTCALIDVVDADDAKAK